MMFHFHWWYIPLGLWLYVFIGFRCQGGYNIEHEGMWNAKAKFAALLRVLLWPVLDMIQWLVED